MQINVTQLATALMLSGSLVGCAAVVKTPYQQPTVNIPGNFHNSKAMSQQVHADVYADQWWTLFGDAQLNQLVNQVLTSNTDLAVAGINLQQARLQAGLAKTSKVHGSAQAYRQDIRLT